jgi:hypothetical protein
MTKSLAILNVNGSYDDHEPSSLLPIDRCVAVDGDQQTSNGDKKRNHKAVR